MRTIAELVIGRYHSVDVLLGLEAPLLRLADFGKAFRRAEECDVDCHGLQREKRTELVETWGGASASDETEKV